jgi:hypothetical protein
MTRGPGRTARRPGSAGAVLLLTFCLASVASPARGWLYSEHRAITARGIEDLEPRRRAQLDRIWLEARRGYEARLCEQTDAGDQGEKPACIDFAAWPAIAGDHSCSPQTMLEAILESDWILPVAAVSSRTAAKIAAAKNENQRRNAQANGDIGLERADRDYSTRAGGNNAHFLLPRQGDDPAEYVRLALGRGAELNAYGLYVLFHVAALRAAATLGKSSEPESRSVPLRRLIALESFALHFLEDAFAAGHIAGSWGKAAERKGTHDYYNEHGLDAESWGHKPMLLFGDGHMREDDLDRAGKAVRNSIAQVAEAAQPGSDLYRLLETVQVPAAVLSGVFDVCKAERTPDWEAPESLKPIYQAVLLESPIPFRGPGFASLPRFRAELGPFIGLASGISGNGAGGGFSESATGGIQGALDIGLRLGVGLDGLLGESGDGLLYVQAGMVSQTASTGTCEPRCSSDPLLQQFVPGVPARTGPQFRLRIPFWLIPGDLILATPFLVFTSPKTLEKMAITATDGGLIPWQTKLETPVGKVQFVVGREVGATLFGFREKDAFLTILDTPNGQVVAPIAIKTIQWDFPVLEIRPFREYGTRYAFSTLLQVGGGFDRPLDSEVVGRPNLPPPPLKTRYFGFLRIFFDGRRYF